jgi:hypothetical protein
VTRKVQAQAVLAKTFPQHAGKAVSKPPPARAVDAGSSRMKAPTPSKATTTKRAADQVALPSAAREGDKGEVKTAKSKEEKLWDIHVRKVKSLAMPLKGGVGITADQQDRRFFEWGKGDEEALRVWSYGGKWTGQLERSWVPAVSLLLTVFSESMR